MKHTVGPVVCYSGISQECKNYALNVVVCVDVLPYVYVRSLYENINPS